MIKKISNMGLLKFDIFEEERHFREWQHNPSNVLAERDDSVVRSLCYDAGLDKHYVKCKKNNISNRIK